MSRQDNETENAPEKEGRPNIENGSPGRTTLREYYSHAGITIYHGEAAQVLPFLGEFDLLCTDPPYGIGENSKKAATRGRIGGGLALVKDYGEHEWDKSPVPQWLLDMARAKCRWQIIFGGNFYTLPPTSCWLIWDKENSGDFADAELAWTNLQQAVRLRRHLWNGMIRLNQEPRFHPTQKPLGVMAWAIQQAGEAKTVLDPFCGSGTTLVAAKEAGKTAVGIDRDERSCEISANRLAQEVLAL